MKINYYTIASGHLASHRYRVLIPSRILAKLGNEIVFNQHDRADVGIFNKHFNYDDYEIACQRWRFGAVVFDVCDNHFDTVHRGHYERMIRIADLVTCGTPEMAKAIKKETGADAVVIPDPYEYEEQAAQYEGGDKLVWFGHPSNLGGLLDCIQRGDLTGYRLKVVSAANHLIPTIPWSHEATKQALSECDIAILPITRNDRNDCKGANRMIESIRCGRFVVAGDLPAYRQFKEWMFVGNIREGLEWAKENRNEIPDRIRSAQEYVSRAFNPETVAKQWQSALISVVGTKSSPAISA